MRHRPLVTVFQPEPGKNRALNGALQVAGGGCSSSPMTTSLRGPTGCRRCAGRALRESRYDPSIGPSGSDYVQGGKNEPSAVGLGAGEAGQGMALDDRQPASIPARPLRAAGHRYQFLRGELRERWRMAEKIVGPA
jgi:hypothetical protein